MTLYGYARVSVREPEDKNLDLQVERLVRAGCAMGNVRAEEASGAKSDRGGLLELLDLVVQGDTLVVSPRWRGNHRPGAPAHHGDGSIPALAGEPPDGPAYAAPESVYPRVGGGTSARQVELIGNLGLSPRWRGNRGRCRACSGGRRSIPALAGEPLQHRALAVVPRVYPRVGGGTVFIYSPDRTTWGLSPRWRGNQLPVCVLWHSRRSIPALAGEPGRLVCFAVRVYPRVGGGTARKAYVAALSEGLSPRWRGNPVRLPAPRWIRRSIPALAGEPSTPRLGWIATAVYPRVGGGTQ